MCGWPEYVTWRFPVPHTQRVSPLKQLCFVLKQHSWLLSSSVVLMFVYTVALIVRQNGCDVLFQG